MIGTTLSNAAAARMRTFNDEMPPYDMPNCRRYRRTTAARRSIRRFGAVAALSAIHRLVNNSSSCRIREIDQQNVVPRAAKIAARKFVCGTDQVVLVIGVKT